MPLSAGFMAMVPPPETCRVRGTEPPASSTPTLLASASAVNPAMRGSPPSVGSAAAMFAELSIILTRPVVAPLANTVSLRAALSASNWATVKAMGWLSATTTEVMFE